MSRMLVIPFFIPFGGCESICIFCDQSAMTAASGLPEPSEIAAQVELYLGTWKGRGRKEVAFYGGTFTAMNRAEQARCLAPVEPFLTEGRIDGIRVSTRPDCISSAILEFLAEHGVDTVELGVQSMNDTVLALSRRGHRAGDTMRAVRELKRAGFTVGLQLMPGLPGDDASTVMATARDIIGLRPRFVRIYPTVVMKNTALEKMTREGRYRPWSMEEMVQVCRDISLLFKEAGIRIARMGLQHTAGLEESIVAGPYHPAFRDLVERAL
ncbi:MAG: elongator complex protein 3 [Thermodesulfobacteriota bacterium]